MKWNLDDIVSSKEFDSLYRSLEKDIKKYDEYFCIMRPSMSIIEFNKFIKFSESFSAGIDRLYWRAVLMESTDQKSQTAKFLKEKVKTLNLKAQGRSRKIWHWIKGKTLKSKKLLDEKNALRLFNSTGDLKYILTRKRELAHHTLSDSAEDIILNKDSTGLSTVLDLRTLIETEQEYFFKPPHFKRGKAIKTQSELLKYVHSPDAGEREAAYRTLLKRYRENLDKFFIIYQSVVKDWLYETKIRNYKSPISMRNKSNNVSDRSINTLLEVCSQNRGIFQSYFKFKAKQLDVKKLRRFDIYAPLKRQKCSIPFKDAVDIVLESLKNFSPNFLHHAENILSVSHIDSHPASGKVPGAFCATVTPNIVPYVFLNYTGTSRDVLTLAHELGHGVHSLYASHHSLSAQGSNLPLAETASTFSEMVVFEQLYKQAKDRNLKRQLLSDKISELYATILRQNYFVIFEIEVYRNVASGKSAPEGKEKWTPELISQIYFNNLKEQFGNSIEIDPLFRYEWMSIPHIVNVPFYCYAYNFGQLLTLTLFSDYKSKPAEVGAKIEKMLSYGGSKDPEKVLKEAGYNVNSPDFWQKGFDIIKNWQKELENV